MATSTPPYSPAPSPEGRLPARFFLALPLLALEVRFLEKASHISAGGVTGIAIALVRWTHLPVGLTSFALKAVVLGLVWRFGGRRVALWTFVAALGSGVLTFLCELIPFHPLPLAVAFPAILLFSYLPSSLLMSAGYSSGGFSALALLFEERGLPVGLTLLLLNGLSLVLMALAYGRLAGILSLLATLTAGVNSQLWLHLARRLLPPASPSRQEEGHRVRKEPGIGG